MQVVKYAEIKDTVTVTNISALSRAKGAKYCECIKAHIDNTLIAYSWRRVIPRETKENQDHVLIEF